MPEMNFENYRENSYEKYWRIRGGSRSVGFEYFRNDVFFDTDKKTLNIIVDSSKEFEALQDDTHGNNVKGGLPSDDGGIEEERAGESGRINKYSGHHVTVPLGEGLLEYCSADLDKNLDKLALSFALSGEADLERFKGGGGEEIENSRSKTQEPIEDLDGLLLSKLEKYKTLMLGRDFFETTLYTYIFPPDFAEFNEKGLNRYIYYLKTIQREFAELTEFCLDVDFYSGDLERLTPIDRCFLYCQMNGIPYIRERTERDGASIREMSGSAPPYGYPIEEIKRRLEETNISGTQNAFEKAYGLEAGTVDKRYMMPAMLLIRYEIRSVYNMLSFEFSKMLEYGVRVKRCKNCGQYFILKGNYNAVYCDRIPAGESKTCQVIAAYGNYGGKLKDDPAWRAYNKHYKRYFARVNVGTVSEDAFRKWKYEAVLKRDQCVAGEMSVPEFTEWLDNSFPTKRKKRTE